MIKLCGIFSIAHSFGKRKAFFANNKHTAPDKAEPAARKYPRGGSYFFFCRQGLYARSLPFAAKSAHINGMLCSLQ